MKEKTKNKTSSKTNNITKLLLDKPITVKSKHMNKEIYEISISYILEFKA